MAWVVGQTPQTRWVMCAASRGSLPISRFSKPRNIMPLLWAETTFPAFALHLDLQVAFQAGGRVYL